MFFFLSVEILVKILFEKNIQLLKNDIFKCTTQMASKGPWALTPL